MKFNKALNLLRKMAKGDYCTLTYKVTWYDDGSKEAYCQCYIDGQGIADGPTWKKALQAMRERINPPKKKPVIVEDVPELEDQ